MTKEKKTVPDRILQAACFHFQNSYTDLPDVFYTRLAPDPVTNPSLVMINQDLARSMGLDLSSLSEQEQAALFAGNHSPEDAEPLAQAYAGHQFGHFTMLGDGRAHVLGEHITPDGRRMDIQFKGSGRTPYSRRGDGRAALGPMLREYIISEAMHALGIPTTRSLAVVESGEDVLRETNLKGAILTRVAASHIRVGTFEYAAARDEPSLVGALLDYTIRRHAPDLEDADNKALAFLQHVMALQADLITHWMRVGFIHGVMNTDNMALCGETIDYGPCAFMDAYDPHTVFSSIDRMGRYAYANQPVIAQWNIARLAETLLPLIDEDFKKSVALAEEAVDGFSALYQEKWLSMMRAKLGLFGAKKEDETLISDLLDWMQESHADYTNTFLDLGSGTKPAGAHYETKRFAAWYQRWQERLRQNTKPVKSSHCLMHSLNPAVIPRNHKVEEALEAASEGDMKPFLTLLAAVQNPYQNHERIKRYQSPPTPSERVYQTFCGT